MRATTFDSAPDSGLLTSAANKDEPDSQSGIGIGQLDASCPKGRRLRAVSMFLTTGEDHRPARGLYESAGATLAAQGPTVSYWLGLEQWSARS